MIKTDPLSVDSSGSLRLENMIRIKRPKAILLDIEGTTTSTSYYPSSVAPYIRNNTESYLREHWPEEHVQAIVRDLRAQAKQKRDMPKILDLNEGTINEVQKSVLNHIEFLYRTNTTAVALLYYQMYVWLDGQMKGILKTHVYKDVVEKMWKWKTEDDIALYIYSSARSDVQMLMFACTDYGSMLHLIDGHFDSKIGNKTADLTYIRIAQAISVPPTQIAFLTDDPKEAKSAKNAGYKALLVRREKKIFSPIEVAQFDIVNSFDKIRFGS